MGDTPPADNALTDRLLRSWLRCRRKAWLDRHGNPAERRMQAAARRRGIHLPSRARQLELGDLESFDHILTDYDD